MKRRKATMAVTEEQRKQDYRTGANRNNLELIDSRRRLFFCAQARAKVWILLLTCLLLAGCGTKTKEGAEVSGEADIAAIPAYSGQAYVEVNGNIPYFEDSELSAESYEYYSELDSLGRCGVCMASIGRDIMPAEERGEIGSIRPSGWHTVKYAGIIDGNYLYNRCHLIGYQLAGENANTDNLITGTRYMNVEGMLPFENMVADYVLKTDNHVMYRVTPVFEEDNLVADGVLIEAKSVEDNGAGISFNVFCYNVQPGIIINYKNGDSKADDSYIAVEENQRKETGAYAVNSKNGKIHRTGICPATGNDENAMKSPVYFGSYEEAEAYSLSIAPEQDKRKCGNCWQESGRNDMP